MVHKSVRGKVKISLILCVSLPHVSSKEVIHSYTVPCPRNSCIYQHTYLYGCLFVFIYVIQSYVVYQTSSQYIFHTKICLILLITTCTSHNVNMMWLLNQSLVNGYLDFIPVVFLLQKMLPSATIQNDLIILLQACLQENPSSRLTRSQTFAFLLIKVSTVSWHTVGTQSIL